MQLSALLQGVEVLACTADCKLEITGVSYDSRKVSPGELFVAVTGFAADGHKFIPMAVSKGARAVLCEREPEENVPYIKVASTRHALAVVSANWFGRPAEKMCMIGVTGTNGKTTSTYLLKSILEQTLGAKVGLIGTIQNMIGDTAIETERTTPESYELQELFAQMHDAGCTHVIMEVSSHALTLSRVDTVRFQVGVFTNLTEDHLDFHKTMAEYCKAKAMLFSRCETGVVNLDDAYCEKIIKDATCRLLSYGVTCADAQLRAENLELRAGGVAFDALYAGERVRARLAIPGSFSVYNALGVIGAALALGLPLERITDALAKSSGVKGRAEVVPTPGKAYTVLIDYSHTPDSLENILRTVRGFCEGRLIAVFGCGGDRDRLKRPIMGEAAGRLADYSIVTSDNPRTEEPMAIIDDIVAGMKTAPHPYRVIENRVQAIEWALEHAQPGDVIVLCGKGHETYQEVNHVKHHMDEREIVAAYLERET